MYDCNCLSQIFGVCQARDILADICEWQDELDPESYDDSIIYNTLDSMKDLVIENIDLQ